MSEGFRVVSVLLGGSGAEYTMEELEERKKVVRSEFFSLAPTAKQLINSELCECVFAENNQLVMAYDLVEARQMQFEFDIEQARRKQSLLSRLILDVKRLKESVEHSQLRISELVSQLADSAGSLHGASSELDKNDLSLLRFIYANRGRNYKIKFPEEEISIQIPMLPIYLPEPGFRIVKFYVMNMSAKKAAIVFNHERREIEEYQKCYPLPKRIEIKRVDRRHDGYDWKYLYVALENHLPVEAKVKVSLKAETGMPAYLELTEVLNNAELRGELGKWL